MSDSVKWLGFFAGIASRIYLMHSGIFGLSERPEFATPLNSYKRLREGIVLSQNDLDPYAGVLFHETPFALKFFAFLYEMLSEPIANMIFIFGDVLTTIVLGKVADLVAINLLIQQKKDAKKLHKDAKEELLVHVEDVESMSSLVQAAYLFHPYLMASCAAKTTTVFANLFLATFLWMALRKQKIFACLSLAFATYQSFYPVMLIVPLILMISESDSDLKMTSFSVTAIFSGFLVAIFYFSYMIMGSSWTFLSSTMGFILAVPELTPNMGLFWYFFTEMFEHFRVFFVCTFQINCFIYVIPLAAKLRNQVRQFHYQTCIVEVFTRKFELHAIRTFNDGNGTKCSIAMKFLALLKFERMNSFKNFSSLHIIFKT